MLEDLVVHPALADIDADDEQDLAIEDALPSSQEPDQPDSDIASVSPDPEPEIPEPEVPDPEVPPLPDECEIGKDDLLALLVGMANTTWGIFTFTRKANKEGELTGWQASCPYHKRNKKTGCKRFFNVGDGSDAVKEETIRRMLHWSLIGPDHQLQSMHLRLPVEIADVQDLDSLVARKVTDRPADVKTDIELIALGLAEAPAPKGKGKGRGRARGGRGKASEKGRGRGVPTTSSGTTSSASSSSD